MPFSLEDLHDPTAWFGALLLYVVISAVLVLVIGAGHIANLFQSAAESADFLDKGLFGWLYDKVFGSNTVAMDLNASDDDKTVEAFTRKLGLPSEASDHIQNSILNHDTLSDQIRKIEVAPNGTLNVIVITAPNVCPHCRSIELWKDIALLIKYLVRAGHHVSVVEDVRDAENQHIVNKFMDKFHVPKEFQGKMNYVPMILPLVVDGENLVPVSEQPGQTTCTKLIDSLNEKEVSGEFTEEKKQEMLKSIQEECHGWVLTPQGCSITNIQEFIEGYIGEKPQIEDTPSEGVAVGGYRVTLIDSETPKDVSLLSLVGTESTTIGPQPQAQAQAQAQPQAATDEPTTAPELVAAGRSARARTATTHAL